MSGQPRRTKCPAVDMAHMDELLQRHVRKYGVNGSFDLGAYMKIQTQNAPQLLAATRKVRNKGWKRVASLAAKITEKKQRGEWLGPDVPIPKNVLPFLKDRIQLVEKKDQQ